MNMKYLWRFIHKFQKFPRTRSSMTIWVARELGWKVKNIKMKKLKPEDIKGLPYMW
jgi:hypothetical protein